MEPVERSRILTTEEYLNLERPKLNWIIQDQVPQPGIVLLQGPPKTGKSFLAFDLARSVSKGIPFLGWSTRKSKTLYLQFDTSELIWRQRLSKMISCGVDLSGEIYTIHPDDMLLPFNLLEREHYKWLRRTVDQSDCELIVVDVLREIHNADENDSTQMKIVGDMLMEIFRNRCLILVHHSKKISEDFTGSPDPAQVARGSSYLTGKVDCLWLLYHNQLYIQGRTAEPQKIKLVQSPSGLWEVPRIQTKV